MKYLNIKENHVRILKKLDTNSPVIGMLSVGDVVQKLKSKVIEGSVWHKIRTRDNVVGYITGTLIYRIKLVQLEHVIAEDGSDYNRARGKNYWPLYNKPSFRNKTKQELYIGSTCWIMDEIENSQGKWYKVRLTDKKEFYIDKSLKFSENQINPPGLSLKSPAFYALYLFFYIMAYGFNFIIAKSSKPPVTLVIFLILVLFWVIFGAKIINRFYRFRF